MEQIVTRSFSNRMERVSVLEVNVSESIVLIVTYGACQWLEHSASCAPQPCQFPLVESQ